MTQLEARNCYLVPVIPVATLLTLLVLAGDAPTALRWGRRTAGDLHDFVVAEAEEAFDMVREIKRAPPVAIVRHVMRWPHVMHCGCRSPVVTSDSACAAQSREASPNTCILLPTSWTARTFRGQLALEA
jgi:hypothetical protein